MDIFRNPDLEEKQEALNEALNEYRDKKTDQAEAQAEQDKKDDDFNEKLQGITEPIAQELLRKPVEELGSKAVRKVVGAVRSRVVKGVRAVGREVGSRLQDQADRLGVNGEDLEALRSGDLSRIGGRVLSRVPTQGSATSAIPSQIDDDTRQVLNQSRVLRGQLGRPAQPTGEDGEPVELDAFTGEPIVRQAEAPRPQGIDEADDWTSQLYDQPITHESDMPTRLPSSRPPASLAEEPENPADRVVANRLSNIFKQTDYSDLPTPSFKPTPRVQPTEASAGDSQALDQLAPMREAMKAQEITPRQALQNRSILQQYKNTDADLTTGQTKTPTQQAQEDAVSGEATPESNVGTLQGQSPPVEAQPAQSSQPPSATDPSAPKPAPEGGTQTSSVDASVSRPAEQETEQVIKKGATSALEKTGLEEGTEIGAEAALDADPLTAPIGLLLGLGTLLGGVFGTKHTKALDSADAQPLANAGVQQGVY